jgi:hypothetical protein
MHYTYPCNTDLLRFSLFWILNALFEQANPDSKCTTLKTISSKPVKGEDKASKNEMPFGFNTFGKKT